MGDYNTVTYRGSTLGWRDYNTVTYRGSTLGWVMGCG